MFWFLRSERFQHTRNFVKLGLETKREDIICKLDINFNLGQAHFAYAVASVYQSLPSLWAPESAHSKSSYLCSCEIPIRTKPTANPIRTSTLKLNEIDATDITKIKEGQANLRFLRRCCGIGLHWNGKIGRVWSTALDLKETGNLVVAFWSFWGCLLLPRLYQRHWYIIETSLKLEGMTFCAVCTFHAGVCVCQSVFLTKLFPNKAVPEIIWDNIYNVMMSAHEGENDIMQIIPIITFDIIRHKLQMG